MAVDQIKYLESGKVQYKAVDSGHSTARVSNCIHALSDVAGGKRLRVASPGWGEPASYLITLRFEPWILDDGQTIPTRLVVWTAGTSPHPLLHDLPMDVLDRSDIQAAGGLACDEQGDGT